MELLTVGVPGDRAMLLSPPGLDFVAAFFGCLYAGFIAVPAHPPRAGRTDDLVASIAADAKPAAILATGTVLDRLTRTGLAGTGLACLPVDAPAGSDPRQPRLAWPAFHAEAATPALLQYTSGSTRTPHGVIVSHGNLLHNSREISRIFDCGPDSSGVSWLPHYHDMGLIGGVIQPMYAGFPMTLMSPISFLRSPFEWLRAISSTGATVSGGPNFAFDLCVQRVSDDELRQLELSRWRTAFNGAEPVRPETLERFAARFAPCGFNAAAFSPCYGLAESTLLVSANRAAQAPVTMLLDQAALEQNAASAPEAAGGRRLAGCGETADGLDVRIVDPRTLLPSAADAIGEIWVAGESVARGYWNRPGETERAFRGRIGGTGDGPFLRTGDLGFVRDGQLFVTGRIKDLIIIRGLNHYPQDVELTAGSAHPILRPDGCAAFTAGSTEDELVVVCEAPRHSREPDLADAAGAVRDAVARIHALRVHAVVLVGPGGLPRTTSGKVRRRLCRARYLSGELEASYVSTTGGDRVPPGEPAGRDVPVLPDVLAAPDESRPALLRAYLRQQVAQVMQLAEDKVPADQPLGRLGLDSLGATRLGHAIEADLGPVIPLDYLLSSPSVDELTARVRAALEAPAEPVARTATRPAAGEQDHPLPPGQAAMWFLDQLAPGSGAFTIDCALRIAAAVDIPRLRRAFEALIERHPVLRTTYRTVSGKPVQQVHDRATDWFSIRSVAGRSDAQLLEDLSAAAGLPFDLARGPVLRVTLFSRAEEDHVLLLSVHHVAADFWSMEILLTELGGLYRAGQPAGASAQPSWRYLDYASWQADLLASEEGERLRSYWRQALHGELPVLQLPADRPRPPVQTYPGAVARFTLDQDLTRRIKALAAGNGATVYMTLHAAFTALLHRYTGQTDIIVGSPFAARGRAAMAGVVGYLVNTLPLRVSLAGDPAFTALLGRVRTTVTQGLAHQDFPFAEIVAQLGAARDPSRSPVYQVAFTFQQAHLTDDGALAAAAFGTPGLRGQLGDLPVESVELPRHASQFDLSLQLAECPDGMAGSFIYNTDLFDAATVHRMAVHLRTLLAAATAAPDCRVSALPMAEPADDGLAGAGGADRAPGALVHRMMEAQAARRPDDTAVVAGTGSLTYRDLNAAANRLARHLRALGAGRGSLVGIMLERGAEQIVAILAVLKAGGAYVPIDPDYPQERVTFMAGDARIGLLLTQESLLALVPPGTATPVAVDAANLAGLAGEDLEDTAGPADLACVLYTSGSAGRPKGVMITHAGLSTQVHALTDRLRVTSRDRHLLAQSAAFAASVRQITLPLCNGGAVVLASAAQVADIVALFTLVRDTGVTMMSANPTLWQHCVAALRAIPASERRALLDNRLRLVLSASEPLTPDVPAWWQRELAAGAQFVNMLGQTEVSGIATTYLVPADGGAATATVPAGTPLPGIQVRVLNQALQPVPDGVAGELCLAGPAVARGYLGKPGLTAERLLPDPHAARPGQRIFRTGDLVRRDRDGVLHHLGRIDGQLKIRGFRVEPAEVEAALLRHPGVRASVVSAHEDPNGGRRLVAYVVPADSTPPTASALRRHMRSLLPEYLVPSVFETLDALPLNANGKVARRELPAPRSLRPALDDEFSPPGSALERAIAAIWAETLGTDRVGIHDSFFDLGGTSLSLMSVHELLRDRLGADPPVAKLFQYPTVHALARYLSECEQGVSAQVERGRATGSRRRRLLDGARGRPPRPAL